jgi:tetratricopeptide (TPR) repeat protein
VAKNGATVREASRRDDGEDLYRRRHDTLPSAGQYLRLISEGGTGAVLLVSSYPDLQSDLVVIKLLNNTHADNRDSVARFRRELANHRRLAEELQVPRLVPCLHLHLGDQGQPNHDHGVFPYYPDGTLEDFARNGGSLIDALRILADAIEGLQSLHGHRYVHRDICPRNIFVSREGGAPRGILGDLGYSMPLHQNTLVSEEEIAEERRYKVGHVGYGDPWFQGTQAADLYGAGATLYRLLTGCDPPQVAEDEELFLPVIAGSPLAASTSLLVAARKVLAGLTCAELKDRYQSAREARLAVAHLASRVAGMGAVSPAGLPGRRSRLVTALALGAGAALAVMLGLQQRDGPHQTDVTLTATPTLTSTSPDLDRERPVLHQPTPTAIPISMAAGAPPQLVETARGQLAEGRHDEAEESLRSLYLAHPQDPEVAGLLALLLARKGEPGVTEARRILEEILIARPHRGELRLALARLMANQGEIDQALQLLAAAPAETSFAVDLQQLSVTLSRYQHQSR